MKRLKHLLWVVPLLLVVGVAAMVLATSHARGNEIEYHPGLTRSIEVRSDDFDDRGEMPLELTCRGEGIAPHVGWRGAPEGTRSYALLAVDWDAPSPSFRLR